jgi:hypothetical protein
MARVLQCTQDLRIKPDLTAPGMVRSAKTSKAYEGKMDSCATTVKEGMYQGPSMFGLQDRWRCVGSPDLMTLI